MGPPRPPGPGFKARGGSPSFIRCTSEPAAPDAGPQSPTRPPRSRGAPVPQGPALTVVTAMEERGRPTPSLLGTPRAGGWDGVATGWRGQRQAGGEAGRQGAGGQAGVGVALQAAREQEASGPSAGGLPAPTPSWSLEKGLCDPPPPLAGCRLEADRQPAPPGGPAPGCGPRAAFSETPLPLPPQLGMPVLQATLFPTACSLHSPQGLQGSPGALGWGC